MKTCAFRISNLRPRGDRWESRSTVRDWLVVAPAFFVPGVASLILVPVLFTTLGADEYGRWVLIYGVAAGVPQVTSTWLEAVTVRFAHRQTIDSRLTALALALTVLLASVAAALFVPGLDPIGIVATAVYTATIASYVLTIARLQSRQHFGALASTAVLRSILTALFAAAGAIIGQSAPAVAIGSAAGLLLGIAVAWIVELRNRRPAHDGADADMEPGVVSDGEPSADAVPGVVRVELTARFASSSIVVAVAVFVLSVGDRFILAAVRPLGEVGVYAATYSIADLAVRLMPAIILVTLRPRLYRAWDAGWHRWVHGQVADAGVVLAWLGTAMGLALLVLGRAGGVLPISPELVGPIAIGITAMFVANVYGLVYTAGGWQGKLAVRIAATAAISILGNLALAPNYGAKGAALVTLVAYATQLAITALASPLGRPRFSRSPGWFVSSLLGLGLAVAAASWMEAPAVVLVTIGAGLVAISAPTRRAVRRIAGASPLPPHGAHPAEG